jgi:hypothetical protein
MTGQDLLIEVAGLRDALRNNHQGVLGRIFDLNDRLTTVKAKRNCVNCATECLARLTVLAKSNRDTELTEKVMIKTTQQAPTTLVKYRIIKPFRPFGSSKTYIATNTTDEEVERLLKAQPQHLLRFTMADGSPIRFDSIPEVVEEIEPEIETTEEVVTVTEEQPKQRKPRKPKADK